MNSNIFFTGIGNLCVDITAHVSDSFLIQHGFKKGECSYIDLPTALAIEKSLHDIHYIPGGSSANTAAGICALGGTAAMLGVLAHDNTGDIVRKDFVARKIHLPATTTNNVSANNAGSTRIFCLTTPDGERSFAAYYGVALELTPENLCHDTLQRTQILNLDGFGLIAPRSFETYNEAIRIARKASAKIAFNPNDPSVIERNQAFVTKLVEDADILHCNEREACLLTNCNNAHDAIEKLKQPHKYVAVTLAEKGVLVNDGTSTVAVPRFPLTKPLLDTNGAGDAFSAGFLYGLVMRLSIEDAAILGTRCASDIIVKPGARP